jgi:deoxycytidylate deaminase
MKVMVQAGIRKVYYFPAKDWELDWFSPCHSETSLTDQEYAKEKEEKNKKSILRLVQNNPIALTLYIPQWISSEIPESFEAELKKLYTVPPDFGWQLDEIHLAKSPGISDRWEIIHTRFQNTIMALYILEQKYKGNLTKLVNGKEESQDAYRSIYNHAIVLAQIAAKRTDDPKIGVGSVLINENGRYVSVGWNGYPKKSQNLDYPHAGADDLVDSDELKYDYILHAEQNALLWRNPTGLALSPKAIMVSTKMPCDECSPVMSDCGVRTVVTIPQAPKSKNDPARLRGLTYEKLSKLIENIFIFK